MPEGRSQSQPVRPEIQRMFQWEQAMRRLEKLGDVWIGPDILIEKKMVVPVGWSNETKIILSKKDLPLVDLDRGVLGSLQLSVRSFLAQSGLEILFNHTDLSDEMIEEINKGGQISFPVRIVNWGQRPIELEDRVMRFFWVNDRNRLRGEELHKVLGSELKIDGVEGKDWYFGDVEPMEAVRPLTDPNQEEEKDVCVILPLSDKKLHIPASSEPLRVRSKKELAEFLKPVPEGEKFFFEIGETSPVHLGDNITAVINTGFYDNSGRHIRSPLIDPNFNGVIRTEVTEGLDSIELFVYKNK